MRSLKTWVQDRVADAVTFARRRHALAQHRLDVETGRLVMGKHTYGMPEIHHYRGSESRVFIGNYCSISPGVVIITGGIHPTDWVSTFPFRVMWNLPGQLEDGTPTTRGDIHIGSDVWIGTDAMILSGVTIGDGAVICSRAVVTRDVPPYSIVAGVPAKVLKTRFCEEAVGLLLKIKWWEWPEEKIAESIPDLSSKNIEDFLRRYSGLAQD